MSKTYAAAAVAGVALFVGGAFVLTQSNAAADRFEACRVGSVAGGDIGGPFTLVSETGETVTDADVITKPTLVYFGFTFCPDVCPMDTDRNAGAMDILQEQGLDVGGLFISIDPERDTPASLAEFTDAFHPNLVGLTGTPEQVAAASKAYRTYYKRQPSDDPEFYLVDHSTFTYLVLPETGFVEFFRRDVSPEAMAKTVACYAANA